MVSYSTCYKVDQKEQEIVHINLFFLLTSTGKLQYYVKRDII